MKNRSAWLFASAMALLLAGACVSIPDRLESSGIDDAGIDDAIADARVDVDADPAAPDAAAPDAAPVVLFPTCIEGCTTNVNCGTGLPSHNADNYFCESGGCLYQGCNSTAECVASFGVGYECLATGQVPQCILPVPCGPNDCVTENNPAANNWSCESGACIYLGCNSTAECKPGLVCASDGVINQCLKSCSMASNCAVAGGTLLDDANNWACENGACVHQGCNDSGECASQFGTEHVCLSLPL